MKTVLQDLNQALATCLRESDDVIILGEDILDPYGGAFKVSRGLSTSFPDRVIPTPVSEAGIVGIGIGMALRGLRPVVEIMFGDFIALAADQLINHAAKLRWMSVDRLSVPLVVRTPMGGGRGYGPTHSQSLEKHFLGAPGLKVVAVSSLDAPGALLHHAVLKDDDPILFIEHKLLYTSKIRSVSDQDEFNIERSGGDYPTYHIMIAGAPLPVLTIVAYGYMAELACQAIYRLAYEHELFCELIVPTQLSPFDLSILHEYTNKTKRLLVVEEGSAALGWGAEVVAQVAERGDGCVEVYRLASLDSPIPAAQSLEHSILPDVDAIIQRVMGILIEHSQQF
jgi:pyruvate/2-oxoglutarate/acetoin dehydrogenase E1 component